MKPYLCECGETDPNEFYGHMKSICKSCANQQTKERFRQSKVELVEYKGGQCQICGYSKSIAALHLHHRDPDQKALNYETMKNWSASKRFAEADKCDLICANCHAETHSI